MNIFNMEEKEMKEFLDKELKNKDPRELLDELVVCGLEIEGDDDMKPINAVKKGRLELEWYVLNHDFNTKQIYSFNVLQQGYILDLIRMIEDKYYNVHNFNSLKECVERWANYHFNHKTEYEIFVKGWFDNDDKWTKISVYDQLIKNLNLLTWYINNELQLFEV